MASSDDTRRDDEMQTPEDAATEQDVDGDEAPVIHQFLFNIHGSDRTGLRRHDASHRRPHLPVLKVVRPEDEEDDAAARDSLDDEASVEMEEECVESSGAMIGHFADDDEWESSEVAALAPHLVGPPRSVERAEASDQATAGRPADDDAAHMDEPPGRATVSVIEWAGGDLRAWRSQPPASLGAGVQPESHAAAAAEAAMEATPIVELGGNISDSEAPVVEATDSEAAINGSVAEAVEASEAAPPSESVDSDMCDAAAAHAAAVELAATAEATAIHGLEARAAPEVEHALEILDDADAAGSLEASPFWNEDEELCVAAVAGVATVASAPADDVAIGAAEGDEPIEEPRMAACVGDDEDGVTAKVPQRVGSGRRIRRNFEWRPGDLFGDGPEPGRHKFNWWQVWRTAAVTAACGVIAVLLVAR